MARPSAPDPLVATEVAGYHIEAVLGVGGMGVVYRARDPWLERTVALKLIKPEIAMAAEFRARFLRESKIAASLEHANVLPIYEAGEIEGVLYLAMRHVPGSDLARLLREEGALEPSVALAILEQVSVALDAAHEKGLVHRDVKPANVLLGDADHPQRLVYLSDFGLTQRRSDGEALTQGEGISGTLDYIAPEQIQGEVVDARADAYSLACVAYECLVGEVPFHSVSAVQLIWSHLEQAPPSPSKRRSILRRELDDVFQRALAKAPEERFSSCRELIAAVRIAATDEDHGMADDARRDDTNGTRVLRNPYKGLRAFDETDAHDFFGRETLADAPNGTNSARPTSHIDLHAPNGQEKHDADPSPRHRRRRTSRNGDDERRVSDRRELRSRSRSASRPRFQWRRNSRYLARRSSHRNGRGTMGLESNPLENGQCTGREENRYDV